MVSILCHPYQLHELITRLRAARVPIQEYPQTLANLTVAGQTLWDLPAGKNLTLYDAPDLREDVLNAVIIEGPRGLRLSKDTAAKKIDAAAALSFPCVAALDARPTLVDPHALPVGIGEPLVSPCALGEVPTCAVSIGGRTQSPWHIG